MDKYLECIICNEKIYYKNDHKCRMNCFMNYQQADMSISTNPNHQNTLNISENEREKLFLEAAHVLRTISPNDRAQAQILLDRLSTTGACKITNFHHH